MRRGIVLSTAIAVTGCGAFLSLSGDDEEDDPGRVAGIDPDASSDAATADGASIVDAATGEDVATAIDAGVDTGVDVKGDGGPSLRVFLTSSSFTGDELGTPDSICGDAKGSLGGTWRAWISHPLRQASNVVTGNGPWRLLNGTLVATDKTQLLSGKLAHAIDVDQNGVVANGDGFVWTGTSESGTATAFHCDQWAIADGGAQGTYGLKSESTGAWTASGTTSCLSSFHIYCFEIP
jgi:hypothetical protein